MNPVPDRNAAQASEAHPELSEQAVDAFLDGRPPAAACLDQDLFGESQRRVLERALGAEIDFQLASSPDAHNRKTAHSEHGREWAVKSASGLRR